MQLVKQYEAYIACLNEHNLENLNDYVANNVIYNGSAIGLEGYRDMLAGNYRDIPDLRFNTDLVVADVDTIASRLRFDCRPVAEFLGLPINGRRVIFHENVFYRYVDGRIKEVWSIIDVKAIANQIGQ
jgi:predicted ester cyclase